MRLTPCASRFLFLDDNQLQEFLKIDDSGDDSNNERHPQKDHPDEIKINEIIISIEDEKRNRSGFEDGFVLSKGAGRDDDTLGGGNSPQACDSNFPSYDHNNHPDRNLSCRNKSNESGDDQEFVGEGIQKFPQSGHHSTASCKIPVQGVGNGCRNKEECREKLINPTRIKK